jgi:hypothetical protein
VSSNERNYFINLYKPRFDKLERNRNLIKYAISNSFTEVEEVAAFKWWTTHKCYLDMKSAPENFDEELWSPYPNVLFTSTSIGTGVKIVCPYCKGEADVTNYDVW